LFFWVSGLLLLHTYFFYPLLLVAFDGAAQLVKNFRSIAGQQPRAPEAIDWPKVTLVVAAYNEAGCIGQKVENSLAIDYPADRFQVIVGSGGSADGTGEIVRERVRRERETKVVLSRAERAGKTSVLNRCIPAASGEIIVLTDANTVIEPFAVKALVRHFED